MKYSANDSLVFAYGKGSPMLAKYLEINGVKGVQVWRNVVNPHGKDYPSAALMVGDTSGFPERREDRRTLPTLKEARALAYAMAEHCELPLIDEDEDGDSVVIHWSDGSHNVSRNLRGLVREFGQSIVTRVTITGKTLRVDFEKVRGFLRGFCETEFSDPMVLRAWICERRNLRGVPCVIDGESGKIPFDFLV